jgi:methanogenic corrinoid protein MtbC1
LIDELYEASSNAPDANSGDLSRTIATVGASSEPDVVCVPARDEADEIVSTMVMQLLRRAGRNAQALPIGAVSTILDQVEALHPRVICVSALPPVAAVQAKSLCKQLRQRCPDAKIILGLWEFPGGVAKAQQRVGLNCADMIGTSIAQVVSLIGTGIA